MGDLGSWQWEGGQGRQSLGVVLGGRHGLSPHLLPTTRGGCSLPTRMLKLGTLDLVPEAPVSQEGLRPMGLLLSPE